MRRARRTIAVVGGGFSGTIVALNLLARLSDETRILLCERAPVFARGAAFATGQPAHLLNVRAANMSPFPDRADEFARWLGRLDAADRLDVSETPVGTFASRGLYGRYLTEILTDAVSQARGAARLTL